MSPAAGALAACSKASSSGVSCLQYEHCSMKRVTVILYIGREVHVRG
jgi:hypothetical protein